MNINKILVLSLLAMMISSQVSARDEITCPTGTASGSTCWKCGDNCTATLTGGKMTVSGTGAMYDYTQKSVSGRPSWNPDAPWSDRRLEITSIKISDGITRVGDSAFALSYNLTSLDLGKTIESIGLSAFHSSSVQALQIPASVKSLGDASFSALYNKDNGARTVVFAEGSQLEEIGALAFDSQKNLTSVTIPDTVTSIGNWAFGDCSGLQKAILPDNSNLTMGVKIFGGDNLTEIVFPGEFKSAKDALQNLLGHPTIYCTQAMIDARKCNSSYLYKTPLTVVRYERDGDHYNVYDSNGKIVAQYGAWADFGTTNYYVPKAPKEVKRIYTVEEAENALGKKNKNTFSIRYR